MHKVICLKCKAERKIKLTESLSGKVIDWLESPETQFHPIVSGRERLDGQMGFQCSCGNNDLMTKQEKRVIKNPVSPKSKEIEEVVKNLQPDKPKFKLVAV